MVTFDREKDEVYCRKPDRLLGRRLLMMKVAQM